MEVVVGGKINEMALLDEGSEIVVIRRDLWEETGHGVNKERKMVMETANGGKEAMAGCAEYLKIEVGGIQTYAHAFIVPHAPFRLLLGRPWQRNVRLQRNERPDGGVDVTVHDP
ncbi:hypothetical protein BDN70DRAFT_818863, partial [Pholiota conissans]